MEDVQITYTELINMVENSVTYNEMDSMERSDFLIEFINRYDIRGL